MKAMKKLLTATAVLATVAITGCVSTTPSPASTEAANKLGITEGATVYTLVNLHADAANNRLHAINYQLTKLMPICSKFVITDIETKVIELTHKGVEYNYLWDKYTRNAGQSLTENFAQFFGKSCDEAKAKVSTLSQLDQKGIKRGKPIIGMSKEGILLAMGRPPIHATPDLDNDLWTYWVNRWARNILEFDDSGKLKHIEK